jgi:hypothetical protein
LLVVRSRHTLVHVPLVARSWPAASKAVGEGSSELLAPAPDRLIGDNDATFSQNQLHIAQTEAEHVIQPDSVADEFSGVAMASIKPVSGGLLHGAGDELTWY